MSSVSIGLLLLWFLCTVEFCLGNFSRSLGTCAELLLLHFSSFTIGRRLEVTVRSECEDVLKPSVPYAPTDSRPVAAKSSHVITVAAPKITPRYRKSWFQWFWSCGGLLVGIIISPPPKLSCTTNPCYLLCKADCHSSRLANRRLPQFLPNYPVPQALRDCVEAQSDVLVVEPCLGEVSLPAVKLIWSWKIMTKNIWFFTWLGGVVYGWLTIISLSESVK